MTHQHHFSHDSYTSQGATKQLSVRIKVQGIKELQIREGENLFQH